MSDEAGEVVVLEVGGKKEASELGRVPDDEAVVVGTPGDDLVGGGVIHHVVSLQKKWCRSSSGGYVHFARTID